MDWDLLQKMRQGFLDTEGHLPDYWHDERWLVAYEETLAQRIRWKWQAVLSSLAEPLAALKGVTHILDWGCGTGMATRALLAQWSIPQAHVALYDRSGTALRFAAKMIQKECPHVTVELLKKPNPPAAPYVLLVSHVLSELDEAALLSLQNLASKAALVLWVEPGRSLESRRLSAIRNALTSTHALLGPCQHANRCGALLDGHEKDWCHFFAPVPREVHHSAFWREFSKRMKVDLRALPVSWLAAVRSGFCPVKIGNEGAALIISRPRAMKGFVRWLACTEDGLQSGEFQKKHSAAIFATLSEPEFMTQVPQQQLTRSQDVSL